MAGEFLFGHQVQFLAQRIQSGMQNVTDIKQHERDNYAKAMEVLADLKPPLVAAAEDYVQARKLWDRGFWIARRLLQMDVLCDVISPSLIPARSGDRVKTDKRDAAKLAKMLRSNDLVAVHITDSVDEAN